MATTLQALAFTLDQLLKQRPEEEDDEEEEMEEPRQSNSAGGKAEHLLHVTESSHSCVCVCVYLCVCVCPTRLSVLSEGRLD